MQRNKDIVRLCSPHYIEDVCRKYYRRYGKNQYACACNADLCNVAVTPVLPLTFIFSSLHTLVVIESIC